MWREERWLWWDDVDVWGVGGGWRNRASWRAWGLASGTPPRGRKASLFQSASHEHELNNLSVRKGSRSSKFEKHWVECHPASFPRVLPGLSMQLATAVPTVTCPGRGRKG